jgi:hypothetical protein
MKFHILTFALLFTAFSYAQDDEFYDEPEEDNKREYPGIFQGSEIGVDIAFSAGSNGGNVGLGLKYGAKFGKYIIAGPSVRYDLTWIKNQQGTASGQNGKYSVYGGGAYIHGRFFNALFIGAEFEYLRSPYDKTGFFIQPTWAPTLFLGGGFSMEFNAKIRLNAGIMYDVINAENSPFRKSYSIQRKTADGQPAGYLPIIYRIAIFIPLG